MWPKVFIIDDSPDYRALLSHHVATHWPDADVRQYDPLESGRLPDDFSGAGNDLILLGHPAGETDALDWLRQFRRIRNFPPVILIGDADERRIVTAIKIGAADYISKQRLNHRRIIEVLEAALGPSQPIASSGRFFVNHDVSTSGLPSLRGYEFQRRLVVNEMSAVYLVRHQTSGEMMILKVLRQVPDLGGEAAFDRFLQEYELIAKLDHPNIIKIFDLGVGDDHAYIAMEYCSKGSLKLRISRGLEPDKAFTLMRQIAGALGELHQAGITHRDLKPTNVMFRDDESLVLIDFGLAKKAALRAEITGTGEIFGTPYYMSPEQGHANDVDDRADIYSLGVIFFEMLTGHKPFEGDTAMAVIVQHQQAPVPRMPVELSIYQPCIDKMMAKKPDDRFDSVAELLEWMPSGCDLSLAEFQR
jgi:serine/threonine protein kinase/CheY-like chemotaxis protein